MREYGVENVRGGDFCGVGPIGELPHFSRRGRKSNIGGVVDRCPRCKG
jgi:hypothetical protein